MHIKLLTCLTFSLALQAWGQPQKTQPTKLIDDDRIERLESLFSQLAEEEGFQGGAMLAQEGEVLWQGSYGYANIQTQEPITDETIFELASVGKAYTAMAILTLVDAGELALDDPASDYVEGFPYDDITVRHLLNHTAGLPDYTDSMSPDELPNGFDTFITNEDVVNWLADGSDGREFEPGRRFSYSNSNYLALALIVESVSGQEFGDYLKDAIFDPLGMEDTQSFTTRYTDESVPPQYAYGYTHNRRGQLVLPESLSDEEQTYLSAFSTVKGDGTVTGTLRDFARWEAAWTTDILIPESLREEAFTPTMLTTGRTSTYAMAWETDPDTTIVQHWGGWAGYTTACYIDPETRTVFAFATNAPLQDEDWIETLEAIIYGDE